MPTAGKMNATLIAFYLDSVKLAHSTEASVSLNMETRDVTTKDSAGWRELLESVRSGSCSFSALYAEDATKGINDMITHFTNRTQFVLRFSTEVTGDHFFEAQGYLTSCEISGGVEDNVTYSGSMEFSGVITHGVVV